MDMAVAIILTRAARDFEAGALARRRRLRRKPLPVQVIARLWSWCARTPPTRATERALARRIRRLTAA
jgi:hypothetical protein